MEEAPSGARSTACGSSRLPVTVRILLESVPLVVRIDTPIEAAYFSAGGILPCVLEQLIAQSREAGAQAPVPPS